MQDFTADFTYCYQCKHLIPMLQKNGDVLYYCQIGEVVIGQMKQKVGRKHPLPHTTRCCPEPRIVAKKKEGGFINRILKKVFAFLNAKKGVN